MVVGKFTHACVFGGVDCKYVIKYCTGKALDVGWLVGFVVGFDVGLVVRVCYVEGAPPHKVAAVFAPVLIASFC